MRNPRKHRPERRAFASFGTGTAGTGTTGPVTDRSVTSGSEKTRCECGTTRRTLLRALPAVSLAPMMLGGSLTALLGGCETEGRSFRVKGGETRALMPPSRYRSPKVRQIYAMAQDHKEVLDKLFCYCYCDKPPFNHKSLLTCYTNDHGAG